MVKDAETHASEDKAQRELIDARNQADSLAYSVEKTLTESKDKLPAGEVEKVQAALEAAKKATQGDDLAAITSRDERPAEGVAPDGRVALQGDAGRPAASEPARPAASGAQAGRRRGRRRGVLGDEVTRTAARGSGLAAQENDTATRRQETEHMAIVRFDPFRELSLLPAAAPVLTTAPGCRRSTSTRADKNELVIKAELPEMKREAIAVTVEQRHADHQRRAHPG